MRISKCFIQISICVFVLFVVSEVGLSQQKSSAEPAIDGLWYGKLQVPSGPEPAILFEITQKPDSSLSANMISVDQSGAMPVRIDEISFIKNSLSFSINSFGISYKGTLKNDLTTIEGNLSQGQAFPLVLKHVDEIPGHPRPQTPKKPYPYNEEEVEYESKEAGIKLAGTLTLPRSKGPFPAVLLIPGSGPIDRNESIYLHKPFQVLADYLTGRGIAVLRVDKRGTGGSTGEFFSFLQTSLESLSKDALAGVNYLKNRKEIDPMRIGLYSHSEGGMVAPMIAAKSSDISHIILAAAPGITMSELLIHQHALYGADDGKSGEQIRAREEWDEKFYAAVKKEQDNSLAEKKIRKLYNGLSEKEKQLLGWDESQLAGEMSAVFSPSISSKLSYNAQEYLQQVKCPVLAINGEKDRQVIADENLEAIRKALISGGNKDFRIKKLANLNHIFQTCETGAESEYGTIEETMSPAALKEIGDWILRQHSQH